MKIITGTCAGKKYKLMLSKTRLTQLSRPDNYDERLFVLLREFNQEPEEISGRPWARLRSKRFPGNFEDRTAYVKWVRARLKEEERAIGCTTFGKRAWKQIKAAIAAAK